MDDLIGLLGGLQYLGVTTEVADKLKLVVGRALREVYSEGHVDGQNAADSGLLCSRDIQLEWSSSQTYLRWNETGW